MPRTKPTRQLFRTKWYLSINVLRECRALLEMDDIDMETECAHRDQDQVGPDEEWKGDEDVFPPSPAFVLAAMVLVAFW